MIRIFNLSLFLTFFCWVGSEFIHTNVEEYKDTKQQEKGSPILPIQSASWTATDALGRQLPNSSQTGPFRKNRYVGIFYFLWHDQHDDKGIYDITKLTKANPTHPAFGPTGAFHWWGEPEAGYYQADDPWVIRRNLQMLTLAGVDVLFLDVTNASIYLPVVAKLCEISLSMRNDGIPTPYICFVTYTKGAETINKLYHEFYSPNRYANLWFRWHGKPLLLGREEEITEPKIHDFFTWRFSWAWTDAKNNPHHWQWLDHSPQNYGWDKDPSVPEEIPVSVAGHPTANLGKSNRNGRQAAARVGNLTSGTNEGLYFDEQWKRALSIKPEMVFVTGWNEWIAQKFVSGKAGETTFLGKSTSAGQPYFIDLYNEEYNRDIEPMKGGYTDSYYYQLVANIRRFKGMTEPEKSSKAKSINIDGIFKEWEFVNPVYNDPIGDVFHRDYLSFSSKIHYVNNTGRNDIIESRVTHDKKNMYFYVKTKQILSPPTNKNWMLLYIDADQSSKTGWQGYDYLINQAINGGRTSVSRWNGNKYQQVYSAMTAFKQNQLEISIPLSTLRQRVDRIKIDFHWADNIQDVNNINEFFINGDNAPDRRFNYRYDG